MTEADAAMTKGEFAYHANVARKEAFETLYWLRMLSEAKVVPGKRLEPLIQETGEVAKILTSIVKKAHPRTPVTDH